MVEHPGPRREIERSERRSATEIIAWILVWFVIVMLVAVAAALISSQWSDQEQSPRVASLTRDQLESEKLRQEVLNLQADRGLLGSLATNATILAGILGVMVTGLKYIDERRRQRLEDVLQHEAEREQRKEDAVRRFDERFTAIVKQLGSNDPITQTNAALSILPFMKDEYGPFHNQMVLVLLAILRRQKIEDKDVNKTVVWVFQKALRVAMDVGRDGQARLDIARWPEPVGEMPRGDEDREVLDRRMALDFSRLPLEGIDLSGLDLTGVDLSFASLRGASLRDASLFRARGFSVMLEGADLSRANLRESRFKNAACTRARFLAAELVAAQFKEAQLSGSDFRRAKLQSAHFDGADLSGAYFQGADVNDAYFRGAVLDASALRGLAHSNNWHKAIFDEDVRDKLDEITGAGAGSQWARAAGLGHISPDRLLQTMDLPRSSQLLRAVSEFLRLPARQSLVPAGELEEAFRMQSEAAG